MAVKKALLTRRIRLHLGIATIFVVVVSALTAAIIWNNHRQASSAALRTAEQLFHEITTKVDERVNGMLGAVKATVDAASAMADFSHRLRYDGLSHAALETMFRMIEPQPSVFSVFAGFGSGDWLQVVAPRDDPDVLATFHAPEGTSFIVRTITKDRNGTRRQYLRFLNRDRHVFGAISETDPAYDPRKRQWYVNALAADQTVFTDPYVFFALRKTGITSTRRLIGGGGAFGVAVTLSSISQFLSEQSASPNSTVFLFNSKGEILAHSDPSRITTRIDKDIEGQPDRAALRKADEIGDPEVHAVVGASLTSNADPQALRQLQVGGQSYLVRVRAVGRRLGLDQYIAVAAPLSDFTRHITQMQQRNIVSAFLALAIALPLIYLIARRIAAKLSELAREADKIRRFDLSSPLTVDSLFLEVHNLSQAFGSMKQAVGMFGRYVPTKVVRQIVQSDTPPELGGRRQDVTVLFTDVADFTRIAERTDPEDLMLRTSEYFEALGAVLSRHNGVVDKYIGDAIMALWNAPSRDDDHVTHACEAALACRNVSRELAESWARRAIPPFATRFGLHCGEAVVGNVGGADRMNFTAVGATINLASRLEALNKRYGTEILVSQDVAGRVGRQFLMRRIDRVQPVGVNTPTDIYELIAVHQGAASLPAPLHATPAQSELCALWDRAYATYVERDWQKALAAFEAVLSHDPQDQPARVFIRRCRDFIETPPPPEWDGITALNQK